MLDIPAELKTIIKQKADIISLAYLFGSYAKGKTTEQSDIDIAVLLSGKTSGINPLLSLELELEIQDKLHRRVDIVILNNSNYSLKFEVIKTGVIIFECDSLTRKFFELNAVREYYDNIYYQECRMKKRQKTWSIQT